MPIINELMINEQIRDKEVRVIGAEGEQIGIISLKEAQQLAADKNMDLVKIAPQAKPPVCKVMDYGKYKFDSAKKEKEARKKQKVVSVKEVKFGANIEKNDFQTKIRNAEKFLKAGDKVKLSVTFRGREMMHTQRGHEILGEAIQVLEEIGEPEQKPKLEGKSMVIVVAPK